MVQVTLPESLSPEEQLGQRAFDAVCAKCHGPDAAATEAMALAAGVIQERGALVRGLFDGDAI